MIVKTVNDIETVDEALRPFYTDNGDGTFTLPVEDKEGASLLSKIAQLNNLKTESTAKNKELTDKLAAFDATGKNPEEILESLKRLGALEVDANDSSKNPEEIEKRINSEVDRRLEGMQRDHKNEILNRDRINEGLLSENTAYKTESQRARIHAAVRSALAIVATPQSGAEADILSRADREWRVNDESGEIEAFDAEGNRKFSKDGKAALPVNEWVSDLHATSPFLFQPSSGGGASGSSSSKSGVGPTGGKPVVDSKDPLSMGQNLAAVARGDAIITN